MTLVISEQTDFATKAIEEKARMVEALEKEPLRAYSYKRLVENGDDAEKLFKK